MVFANIHATDELAFESGFVGDGAHDVASLDAVRMPDFDAVGFALDVVTTHRDVGSGVLVGPVTAPCNTVIPNVPVGQNIERPVIFAAAWC